MILSRWSAKDQYFCIKNCRYSVVSSYYGSYYKCCMKCTGYIYLSVGAIIGIVIGGLAGLLIFFCIYKKWRGRAQRDKLTKVAGAKDMQNANVSRMSQMYMLPKIHNEQPGSQW